MKNKILIDICDIILKITEQREVTTCFESDFLYVVDVSKMSFVCYEFLKDVFCIL